MELINLREASNNKKLLTIRGKSIISGVIELYAAVYVENFGDRTRATVSLTLVAVNCGAKLIYFI